jgi:N-acetylmuramoyl-L-alanine amidase
VRIRSVPVILMSLLLVQTSALQDGAVAEPVIEKRLIPEGAPWRIPERKMVPEYITIHSTANEAAGADAAAHARLLSRPEGFSSSSKLSRTGYRSWHFTVDDRCSIQHLPTDEQADHADFTGPGNQTSIGIEICVNKDGNLEHTIERTVDLVAFLMKQHRIDLGHVVPHHYWAQPPHGYHKACPAIFMDGSQPGPRWQEFLARVADRFRDQERKNGGSASALRQAGGF